VVVELLDIVSGENRAQTVNQNGDVLVIAMCDAMTGGSAVRAALLRALKPGNPVVRHGLCVVFCT